QTIDGDQIMALIATGLAEQGLLKGGGVVATVMSNLGLERYLDGLGLRLVRAKVGDRYVLEAMRAGGYNLGGEQSGHMIMLDHATTGDGCIAALQVLAALVRSGKRASELLHQFDPVPQVLKNVVYSDGDPLVQPSVQEAIADGEAALGGRGRLVIRKSGTEPKIRVMAEGDDATQVERVVDSSCEAVKAAAGDSKSGRIANAAAPICPRRPRARSSAASTARSARRARKRSTIPALTAAANWLTDRRLRNACSRSIRHRPRGVTKAHESPSPYPCHRRVRQFGRRRNPGRHQDDCNARRLRDDRDHRDYGAELARRHRGRGAFAHYGRRADRRLPVGYRRGRGKDRDVGLPRDRPRRRRPARNPGCADRLRPGDGLHQRSGARG